jgi:hypothetical protein
MISEPIEMEEKELLLFKNPDSIIATPLYLLLSSFQVNLTSFCKTVTDF